jgi:hypothetical protein
MEPTGPRSAIKDPKRVDLDDRDEVDAWCESLRISPDDLRTAVGVIGPMSAAVAAYVNSRGRRGQFRQVGEIGHPFARGEQATEAGAVASDDATSGAR